jgi:hypothetical protein
VKFDASRLHIFSILQQIVDKALDVKPINGKGKFFSNQGKQGAGNTILKVTMIEENARDSNGISSRAKSAHSRDSGPGEKLGVFNLARKIM